MNQTNVVTAPNGFEALQLIEPLCRAVAAENYATPTPIQLQAIPHVLQGRDILGCAQTGTGKTAAFALPILQRLTESRKAPAPKSARALILAPTRELAAQIHDSFRVYGRHLKLTRALVFGGVKPGPQMLALKHGVDILVATPGRLLDLMQQGGLRLDRVEILVLDEADRMLDMGFLPDVRRIHAAIPAERQSLLFSATLPDEIQQLTRAFLRNPVHVSVTPPSTTVERIDQRILFVDRENKRALLNHVLEDRAIERVLVFARTKRGANKIAQNLNQNRVQAEAIHGNKSQSARLQALEKFRTGRARVLVATDIASRGLDVDGITHVINYELPLEAESYVHRIGRTARAGTLGVALSFCDAEERSYLRDIEKGIRRAVVVDEAHPFHSSVAASSVAESRGGRNPRAGSARRTSSGSFRRGESAAAPAAILEWSRPSGSTSGGKRSFRPRSSRNR